VVDADIHLRDTVRLLIAVGGIPAGTLGSVLGRFVGEETYIVNFAEAGSAAPRVAEVRSDEVALAAIN
jgi:hypothetical protein